MTGITYDSAITLLGARDTDDLIYDVIEAPTLNNPTITNVQSRDITYQRFDGAGVANNFILSGSFDVENLTPGVAQIEASNEVKKINLVAGGGNLRLLLKNDYCQKILERNMTTGGSVAYSSVTEMQTGSLRKYLLQQVIDAFQGASRGQFSQRVRIADGSINPNNILRTAKGSYTPPSTDILNEVMVGGTGYKFWITPHHYLGWRGHYIKDTATSKQIYGEIAVTYSSTRWNGTLCKLMPANYRSYLPLANLPGMSTSAIPCFTNLYHTYGDPAAEGAYRFTQPAWWDGSLNFEKVMPSVAGLDNYQYRNSKGEIVTSGDSGSSVFTVVNGELVPFGHVAYKGKIGTFFYGDNIAKIQEIVSSLNASGSFTIQTIDLSMFNEY